jgi:hypothetical protein
LNFELSYSKTRGSPRHNRKMAQGRNTSTSAGVDLTGALMHGGAGIKKKIRDISRLLSKDVPADVKIANERALKTLKLELEKVQEEQMMKKLSQRYHKVRFFEKKKAVRFYKRAFKAVNELEEKISKAEGDDEVKELKKELKKEKRIMEHCKVDLAYILNFPRNMKYIALYARAEIKDDTPRKAKEGIKKTNAKREEIKKAVSEGLRDGTLEVSIEEGLAGIPMDQQKTTRRSNASETTQDQVDDVETVTEVVEDDFFES